MELHWQYNVQGASLLDIVRESVTFHHYPIAKKDDHCEGPGISLDVMTKVVHATIRASSSNKNPPNPSIWITDSLLTEAFERFARGSRRHGSHVPGPLEARRRVTGRRNTSLAHVSLGAHTLEADVVLGSNKQQGWWSEVRSPIRALKRSESAETPLLDRTPSRFLPSWFALPPDPPRTSAGANWTLSQLGENFQRNETQFQRNATRLRSSLQLSKNLDDLRNALSDLGPHISLEPRYSEIAFQHILDSHWHCGVLAAFLADPFLNPLGTRNFLALILGLRSPARAVPSRQQREIRGSITRAICLGTISPEHIKEIILTLPDLRVSGRTGMKRLADLDCIQQWYTDILCALEKSSVLDVGDLGQEFIPQWLALANRSSFTSAKAKFLWHLRADAGVSELELLAFIVREWLACAGSDLRRRRGLTMFLKTLSPQLLATAVFGITEKLVLSVREGLIIPAIFDMWRSLLPAFDDEVMESPLAPTVDVFAQASSSLTSRERLVVFAWTAVNICESTSHPRTFLKRLGLGPRLEQAFSLQEEDGTGDLLARILQTLQLIPLPEKSLFIHRLGILTENSIDIIGHSSNVEADALMLLQRRFGRLLDDSFYSRTANNFNDVLVEFSESINKDLSAFRHISRALIARDKLSFRVVTRLLKHNRALKMTLSQSFPQRLEKLAEWERNGKCLSRRAKGMSRRAGYHRLVLPMSPPAMLGEKEPEQVSQSSRTIKPQEVLNLINHLAISFAITQVVDPLSAFRKVVWCYHFLRRYGAPILPPITRALWHAGVTRYAETGASLDRFKWILTKVRLVEGDEVARSLLWSAGFREGRKQDMEAFSLVDEDGRGRSDEMVLTKDCTVADSLLDDEDGADPFGDGTRRQYRHRKESEATSFRRVHCKDRPPEFPRLDDNESGLRPWSDAWIDLLAEKRKDEDDSRQKSIVEYTRNVRNERKLERKRPFPQR